MTDYMKNFINVTTHESIKKFGPGNMVDLVLDFFERFKEDEIKKDIENNDFKYFKQCYDDSFKYYDDLWTILRFYQLPHEVNFNEAMKSFYADLSEIYTNI